MLENSLLSPLAASLRVVLGKKLPLQWKDPKDKHTGIKDLQRVKDMANYCVKGSMTGERILR